MGPELLFPQSLIKQQNQIPNEYSADSGDFKITFNENFRNMNYQPNLDQIHDGMYDFERLVAHEILHGLGFTRTLQLDYTHAQWKRAMTGDILQPIDQKWNKNSVIKYLPLSIFESFMYVGSQSLLSIAENIRTKYNTLGNRFMQSILSKRKLYNLATSSNVHLKLPNNSVVYLNASRTFLPSSSLSHLHNIYKNTSDFVIVSGIGKGKTLNSLMKTSNSTNVLGPNVRSILESVGWTTRDKLKSIELVNVSRDFYMMGFSNIHHWNSII